MHLVRLLGVTHDEPVVDVGGGASILVDELLDDGFVDITVLDVSSRALAETRARIADDDAVSLIQQDLLAWTPWRTYRLWHDRAVLHFLTEPREREAYARTMRAALRPGGAVIIGAFAPDGPSTCSGLAVVRFSSVDLAGLLGEEFDVVREEHHAHTTPAGVEQPFTWVAARRKAP
jgi:trans-aconitate methyltransferase